MYNFIQQIMNLTNSSSILHIQLKSNNLQIIQIPYVNLLHIYLEKLINKKAQQIFDLILHILPIKNERVWVILK